MFYKKGVFYEKEALVLRKVYNAIAFDFRDHEYKMSGPFTNFNILAPPFILSYGYELLCMEQDNSRLLLRVHAKC